MRMPWHKPNDLQLDLLDAEPEADVPDRLADGAPRADAAAPLQVAVPPAASEPGIPDGRPMLVAITLLHEDANNPRTEFPEVALEELAADIQQRGILQPLDVRPADGGGRHRIHFGAMRLRAAIRAGLHEVPIVVRDLPVDRYAQVAENQKRHGLTPIEMAKFIREQVDSGDSNATIGRRLGMNLTTVAHHLSLLELPSELDEALNRAEPQRFSAALSDESMPEMTGSEMVAEIRKIRADIPIVPMSECVTTALSSRARYRGGGSSVKAARLARHCAQPGGCAASGARCRCNREPMNLRDNARRVQGPVERTPWRLAGSRF